MEALDRLAQPKKVLGAAEPKIKETKFDYKRQ